MYTLLLLIHVIVCIALTIVILLQSSKGGGLSGVFGGGGGMGTVFGGRGVASFLSKLTTGLAIAFLLICLILGKITSGESGPQAQQSAVQKARNRTMIPMHSPETTGEEASLPAPEAEEAGSQE